MKKIKGGSYKYRLGFTLMELLVVMAISVILVGLVLYPVTQSFRITRRAQAMTDAQDAARYAMEVITREIGEAMYVYDNSSPHIMLPVLQPDGTTDYFELPYAKIDIILPKIVMHCNSFSHPEDKPRDYPRGMEAWPPCPYCKSTEVEARPKLPLEQDVTIVRYFLGLLNNDPTVNNFGWQSPWIGEVAVGEGNQVVLYRMEFNPMDPDLFDANMKYEDRAAIFNNPRFFYDTRLTKDGRPLWKYWAEHSQVIGVAKYEDLVEATFNENTGEVLTVEPTVTFKFAAIDNDTFSGAYSSDRTFEYPDAVPTVFRAAYGYWTPNFGVTAFRNDFSIAYTAGVNAAGQLVIWKRNLEGGNWTPPTEIFNVTNYLNNGSIPPETEMAFTIDTNRGIVNFALKPPDVPEYINTARVNKIFEDTFRVDRGSARRYAILNSRDMFDPTAEKKLLYARIVPGSERVIGPDMTPGAPAGRYVRYERVPLGLGDAGLNQYKIDYDSGYIFFSPVYDYNLPQNGDVSGNTLRVSVDYLVQFNRKGDVIRGDYITKSLINIHLGMRMFDPDSAKPHPVELNNSVKVRNAIR